VFENRKNAEEGHLSSHGEAGRYFVSFCDNHDQHERIQHPSTPPEQVLLALALLFSLQGIPCVYYGTEQGLSGCVKPDGSPDLASNESSREALWGKPLAFDKDHPVYKHLRRLSALRVKEPPLSFGRLYFREISQNGKDFGHSFGMGGLVAFSRILVDREVLVIANTGPKAFQGSMVIDLDINMRPRTMKIAYSNLESTGSRLTQILPGANFFFDGGVSKATTALLPVDLKANEIQIFTPA
jgi:glycosidase